MTRALVAAVAASALLFVPGSDRRERIVIDIHHSAFVPERIEVERGTVITFVIENGDPIDHEFILGDQEVQDRHESGTEPHHGDKPGEVSIPAGETGTTTYEFTEPGTLIFGCHLPGHYNYGMRGVVEVM